ncbi:hypothetical protein Dalk_4551 [Desulfatibacillum aliphaticivorans]|uniref:Uncharacterized protein n=1 Tax=Desulfatibacillum aliphaticivorans TaxID=218208 RepID=B8FCR6_DESAL|nr:DUF6682 family protein [Desulfatibacillum aliphaticivorans]ACL06229.1 hypothetical protein Dalk_4551 [Desulfatibacillum aliphaticivorans]
MKKLTYAVIFTLLLVVSSYAGTTATSGITAQTIIDRIEQELNDESGTLFSDAEAVRWINEAVNMVAEMSGCLELTQTVTLAANTQSYSVTTSHYDILSAMYDNGSSSSRRFYFLAPVSPNDPEKFNRETGRPQYFFEWANYVYLWPIPDSSVADTTVTLFLAGKPTGVSATSSTIETPYYFDKALLDWCCYKFWKKANQIERAMIFRQSFEQVISRYTLQIRKPLQPAAQ